MSQTLALYVNYNYSITAVKYCSHLIENYIVSDYKSHMKLSLL